MDDLISRQAAIDAFNTNLNELVVGGEENAKTVENYLNRVLDKIKYLPSALSTNLAEVGTDCISRQQAIDALRKLREEDIEDYGCEIPEGFNQDHLDRATFAIKQLQPIQPDIVRCKDCKYWIPYDWMFGEVWQSKNIADYPEDEIGCNLCDVAMKANDFCSRGERREVTE